MSMPDDQQQPSLPDLRKQIDQLDERIVELLSQRAEVVVGVGRAKQTDGTPIYAPDREHAVLRRICELNPGPLPQRTLQAIYRELMSGSFALEKPLMVGYLGPKGSHSHAAAKRKFGSSVVYRPLADIRAVFEEVSRGHVDLGMVPVENSLMGGVIETLDCFSGSSVHICAEVIFEVHHNLLGKCRPEEVKVLASKPEVFAQCRSWLSTWDQKVEMVPVASSSRAAEMAANEQHLAAIGSSLAAELYDLKVLFANIEDKPDNMTRFFVLGKQPARRTGQDKTTVMFTTAHRSGALVEVLNVFSRFGVNLTNIDTRPSRRRNWEYFFFIDAEGHFEDENMIEAIEEARDHCGELQVLGSFPRASEPL